MAYLAQEDDTLEGDDVDGGEEPMLDESGDDMDLLEKEKADDKEETERNNYKDNY